MMVSNYDVMRNKMREEFIKYDQNKMIRKFSLKSDEKYIYIEFVRKPFRIDRRNGIVEWSDDDFDTVMEAGYDESMTIYDVLCYSKDNCCLAGKFCPAHMLRGTVKSATVGSGMYKTTEKCLQGRIQALRYACNELGEDINMSGDVAAQLYPFPFLPVTLQFWDADEEFDASLKFMFDENIVDYMHYETIFFMMNYVLECLKEKMNVYEVEKGEIEICQQ